MANRNSRGRRGRADRRHRRAVEVYAQGATGKGQVGYDVNSTMIIGERDILLIDPSVLAERGAQAGRRDPRDQKAPRDHLHHPPASGPSVRTGGAQAGVPGCEDRGAAGDRQRGEDRLAGAPEILGRHLRQQYSGPRAVLPEELASPVLTLEGEEFPITGGVQGADGPGNSFVWVPSLKTVVTGDIVFDHVYFGVPRPEPRANWQKTIDQIAALNRSVVVPGHEGPGATRDMRRSSG